MAEKQISERDRQQLRRDSALDSTKKVRFGSGEVYLTIAVILVIAGILLTFAYQYIQSAKTAIRQSNAHSIYLAIVATDILDQPTAEDLRFFQAKYLGYQPVEALLEPQCRMEQSVAARLDNSAYAIKELEGADTSRQSPALPITGYMKLEWQGETLRVYLSDHPDGTDAVTYPQISVDG